MGLFIKELTMKPDWCSDELWKLSEKMIYDSPVNFKRKNEEKNPIVISARKHHTSDWEGQKMKKPNVPSDPTKTPIDNKAEYQAAKKQARLKFQFLKKKLKLQSKSQLIHIIVQYASDLQEQQELNKFLYEENKELKND